MPELRILVVEDESTLLNMIADSLSRSGQVWRAISGSPCNQFDDIIVARSATISQAQSLIDHHPKFHLFILDISVKADPSSTLQGDGLSLIQYAITAKKKPSAVVSLTGTVMDAGRAVIQNYYDETSYDCLSKFVDPQHTINGFVDHLTENVIVNELTMPKILSLCSSQAYLTVTFNGMKREVPVIELHHSEDSRVFTITHRRTCLFLHHLGWVSNDRTISESEIAQLFGGIQLKNVSGDISKIRNKISDTLSPLTHVDKAFIDQYLFTAIHGTQGFRLVARTE